MSKSEDMDEAMREILDGRWPGPRYYRRDGTLFADTPEKEAAIQWAEMFQSEDRIVAQDRTLYGEKLSTVFLGLDHRFLSGGPPILFETMLFAPRSPGYHKAMIERLTRAAATMKEPGGMQWDTTEEERYIEKNFPHDNLQQRYSTEAQAARGHRRLKLQCLVPPRWRKFVWSRLAKDEGLWD